MSRASLTVVAVVLFAMSAVCSGCVWIAVPSLAYQSYKYESGGQQTGQTKQHESSPAPAPDNVE